MLRETEDYIGIQCATGSFNALDLFWRFVKRAAVALR